MGKDGREENEEKMREKGRGKRGKIFHFPLG